MITDILNLYLQDNWVIVEKLIVPKFVKKYLEFYFCPIVPYLFQKILPVAHIMSQKNLVHGATLMFVEDTF